MRLENVNAVITGATSGIGRAVSRSFRREGARLVLTGRKPDLADVGAAELYVNGDLNDESFVRELADRAGRHLGTVDVVVIGHGRQFSSVLVETAAADAQDVLNSNLLSAFFVMKSFIPLIPADQGGSIVCVSSRLGIVAKSDQTLYSAAKGGLIMLARGAARRGAAIELAEQNIRVNVVAPGLTSTDAIEASFMRRPDPEGYRRMRESAIPLRRLATPDEIADAVLFFAAEDSAYVTGTVLPVDGGYTAY